MSIAHATCQFRSVNRLRKDSHERYYRPARPWWIGEGHWQDAMGTAESQMRRFQPASRDRPELTDWIAALDQEISRSKTPPVLCRP